MRPLGLARAFADALAWLAGAAWQLVAVAGCRLRERRKP